MSLRYLVPPRDPNPTGKFLHRRRPGTVPGHERPFADWTYQLIAHHTGTTVKRTVYNVSISDPKGNQVAYLQDFGTAERASAAAREWIEQRRS